MPPQARPVLAARGGGAEGGYRVTPGSLGFIDGKADWGATLVCFKVIASVPPPPHPPPLVVFALSAPELCLV